MYVWEDVSVSVVCQLASLMCTCTSTPVWQLSNLTSAVSSVSSTIHIFGYHDGTSNSAFNLTVPHLSSLCCRLHMLLTPPRVTLCVLQACCLWHFCPADHLHHTGALAGVLADFHTLSSPSLTQPSSLVPHPAHSFCQPQQCHSWLLRLLLCPVWHTWHVR